MLELKVIYISKRAPDDARYEGISYTIPVSGVFFLRTGAHFTYMV